MVNGTKLFKKGVQNLRKLAGKKKRKTIVTFDDKPKILNIDDSYNTACTHEGSSSTSSSSLCSSSSSNTPTTDSSDSEHNPHNYQHSLEEETCCMCNNCNYVPVPPEELWYTMDEAKAFQEENERTCRMMMKHQQKQQERKRRKARGEETEERTVVDQLEELGYCTRGLERKLGRHPYNKYIKNDSRNNASSTSKQRSRSTRKRRAKTSAELAVFDEQDKQAMLYMNEPEEIAKLYSKECKPSKKVAIAAAKSDEEAARQIYLESELYW